ncbi:MAG TPA: HEAT repeat domain-containing protein [Planctomycetota bacterium]|nr:HEAT repeat domain-containing protein [Planctomycetota bacterium]
MRLLAAVAILVLVQEPPPDDVGPRFHPPLPPEREWEMAEAYFWKIATALRIADYDLARTWDRRARDRVAPAYRERLKELGGSFWGELKGLPANRALVEFKAVQFAVSLNGGTESDVADLRRGAAALKLPKHQHTRMELSIAVSLACGGEYDTAERLLESTAKEQVGEDFNRSLEAVRTGIAAARAAADKTTALKSLVDLPGHFGGGSCGPGFAILKQVESIAKEGVDGESQRALKALAAVALKSLGDGPGASAVELKSADPAAPPKEPTLLPRKRAKELFDKGDYKSSAKAYREILEKFPEDRSVPECLYYLGRSLQLLSRPADARQVYEQFSKARPAGRGDDGHGRYYYNQMAVLQIGACFEAEKNWKEALAIYESLEGDGRERLAGHWVVDRMDVFEGAQRCRVKLGLNDAAIKAGREFLSSPFRGGQARCIVHHIDLAFALGRFEEEERWLATEPADSPKSPIAIARDYVRVLRRRQEHDIRGLFDLAVERTREFSLFGNRWDEARWGGGLVPVEAIECLAELGDPAVEFLKPIVRLGSARGQLALLALARMRNDASKALFENVDWIGDAVSRDTIQSCRRLAADPPRDRPRLPEKAAAPPDPKEAERLKGIAAKFRERFPELAAKVPGIETHIAPGTNYGLVQALGETILAWKKGRIIDEDLEDLIAYAIEEKWTLEPRTLLAMVRDHRAAPAAPLLAPLLKSQVPAIRGEAAELVGRYGLKKSIPDITALLQDPDADVGRRATWVLVALDAKEAVPAIAAILDLPLPDSRKSNAIHALGRLKALDRAGEVARFLMSKDTQCRAMAAEALGAMVARDFIPQLQALLKDSEEWVRRSAEAALKNIENPVEPKRR